MLTFNEFQEEVKDDIVRYLPKDFQNAEVIIGPFQKLGHSYTALTVRKDGGLSATPAVNLDRFYEKYLDGLYLQEVMSEMADVINKNQMNVSMDWISDYSSVKDRLFIRVSNAERNKALLERIPHRIIEDLALTCHVVINKNSDYLSSTTINNQLLEKYGITKEQLIEDAIENSEKIMPLSIKSMDEVLESVNEIGEMTPRGKFPMYVITNERNINGAASIFYNDAIEEVSKRCNGDFYLVPSSIHEMLAIPVDSGVDVAKIEQTLEFVNDTQVEEAEQLGDHLYRYNSNECVLQMVEPSNAFTNTMTSAFMM